MGEKLRITFRVAVFSKYGSLVDKFTVEAATKKDAHELVVLQLKAEGIYKDVNYKIT